MPNLEYSVKLALASNATQEITNVITKISKSGKTISVKLTADTSQVKKEMEKVESEIKKYEKTNEKLAGTTKKTTSSFKQLSEAIKKASNQIRATSDYEKAAEVFAKIDKQIQDFGKGGTKNLDNYHRLLLQLKDAYKKIQSEARSTSASVSKNLRQEKMAIQEAQRAVREKAREERELKKEIQRQQAEIRRQERQQAQEARKELAQKAREQRQQAQDARRLAQEQLREERQAIREAEKLARDAAKAEKEAEQAKVNALKESMRQRQLEAKSITQNQRLFRDGIQGQISILRRLSAEGRGTKAEIEAMFGRPVREAKNLEVSLSDVRKAFADLRKQVEASNLPFRTQQSLINNLVIAQQQSATSIRQMNRSLAQQGEGVGEVSYAMLSFSRLLEDVPYGFRGFANNIQPTIFGLLQMNGRTEELAMRFERLNGRSLPLGVRMMKNLKLAVTGPVNQLILLTSVIAVAGTVIEQMGQKTKKAEEKTKSLSSEFLRLMQITDRAGSILGRNFTQEVQILSVYEKGLKDIETQLQANIKTNTQRSNQVLASNRMIYTDEFRSLKALIDADEERLAIVQSLSAEAKERLDDLRIEAEVIDAINKSRASSATVALGELRQRDDVAKKEVENLEDQIAIERVRQAQGDRAALAKRKELEIQRLISTGLATDNEIRAINLRYQLDIINLAKKEGNEREKIKYEYESILENLRRQLEDERELTSVQRLEVQRKRELADLEKTILERKEAGENIDEAQQARLTNLINKRFDILVTREEESSANAVQSLVEQYNLTEQLIRIEQMRTMNLEKQDASLEFTLMEMERQKELREALNDVERGTYANDKDRLAAIKAITNEINAQFKLELMRIGLQSQMAVTEYLSPASELDTAIMERNQAILDNEIALQAELRLIREDATLGEEERAQKLLDAEQKYQAQKNAIVERGEKLTAFIRYKTQTDGIMMVTGALEQLVGSMDANSKKQFENQKKLSISLALINAYLSASQVLADPTIVPSWLKYAQAAAMGLAAMAQVNQIRNTKYGGSGSGSTTVGRQSTPQQGFQEVNMTRNAMSGAVSTMSNERPSVNVTVIGNVDREGIAFAVRDGEEMISSRATFAR